MASGGASLVSLICAQTAIRGLNEDPCKKKRFDLGRGFICFCADAFPDWYKWLRGFTFQIKMPGCCHPWGEGWVGGGILSRLLALLAVYLHVLAILPLSSAYNDSLCMSTLRTNTNPYPASVLCKVFTSEIRNRWENKRGLFSTLVRLNASVLFMMNQNVFHILFILSVRILVAFYWEIRGQTKEMFCLKWETFMFT